MECLSNVLFWFLKKMGRKVLNRSARFYQILLFAGSSFQLSGNPGYDLFNSGFGFNDIVIADSGSMTL